MVKMIKINEEIADYLENNIGLSGGIGAFFDDFGAIIGNSTICYLS